MVISTLQTPVKNQSLFWDTISARPPLTHFVSPHLVAFLQAVQQVQLAETATCAPLQRLWRLCHEDGPPLSAPRRRRREGDWIHILSGADAKRSIHCATHVMWIESSRIDVMASIFHNTLSIIIIDTSQLALIIVAWCIMIYIYISWCWNDFFYLQFVNNLASYRRLMGRDGTIWGGSTIVWVTWMSTSSKCLCVYHDMVIPQICVDS